MKLKQLLVNKLYRRLVIILGALLIVILGLRIAGIDSHALAGLIEVLMGPYLFLVESVANFFIGIIVDGVSIQDHVILNNTYEAYFAKNEDLVTNWRTYLLFLKWTAFLLFSIWIIKTDLKRKLLFSGLLVLVHFFAVSSGLIMLAAIGPKIVIVESLSQLRPHLPGALAMFGLFALWIRKNRAEIALTIKIVLPKAKIDDKKVRELMVIFLIFILLKSFLIPYFPFYTYIDMLLTLTQALVGAFGFNSEINGPYLIGDSGGTLFMAKWCLGFITMFVFSSVVYVTRRNNRSAWIFILSGVVVLHIFNIIRLAVLFIFVQSHDDSQLVMDHHDLYSIVVYLLIFLMWIFWFEKFALISPRKAIAGKSND